MTVDWLYSLTVAYLDYKNTASSVPVGYDAVARLVKYSCHEDIFSS
jgi:hypothetical protein